MFPLFLTGNARLHSQSQKVPHAPPPTWYFKTQYTDNLSYCKIQFRDDRAAIVSAQRVRNRGYSQSGLGAEKLLPEYDLELGAEELLRAEIAFCSRFFFLLFLLIIIIFIFFFSFFSFLSSFLFRTTLLIVNCILNPVVFSVAQKSPA